jgi:hypothetical protein
MSNTQVLLARMEKFKGRKERLHYTFGKRRWRKKSKGLCRTLRLLDEYDRLHDEGGGGTSVCQCKDSNRVYKPIPKPILPTSDSIRLFFPSLWQE